MCDPVIMQGSCQVANDCNVIIASIPCCWHQAEAVGAHHEQHHDRLLKKV